MHIQIWIPNVHPNPKFKVQIQICVLIPIWKCTPSPNQNPKFKMHIQLQTQNLKCTSQSKIKMYIRIWISQSNANVNIVIKTGEQDSLMSVQSKKKQDSLMSVHIPWWMLLQFKASNHHKFSHVSATKEGAYHVDQKYHTLQDVEQAILHHIC